MPYTFSIVQRATTAQEALDIARRGSYLTDGILTKTRLQVIHDRALPVAQAEDMALACLSSSDGTQPYNDPDSPEVGAIAVAERAGGPTTAWLLFGTTHL